MNNFKVMYEDMPTTIGALVKETDGFYDIIINARMSVDRQQRSYREEIYHIQNNDHERTCSVDQIELEAHRR